MKLKSKKKIFNPLTMSYIPETTIYDAKPIAIDKDNYYCEVPYTTVEGLPVVAKFSRECYDLEDTKIMSI